MPVTWTQSIEPVFGCALGEVVEVPDRKLLVAEMLAPRPMQRGELFTSDYLLTFGRPSSRSFRLSRAVSDPVKALSLAVRFEPSALPTSSMWPRRLAAYMSLMQSKFLMMYSAPETMVRKAAM